MQISINIFFIRYGYNDYKNSFEELYLYLKKIKKIKCNFYIIENKKGKIQKKPNLPNVTFLRGNNKLFEFSAMDKILAKIHKEKFPSCLTFFITSAYKKNYSGSDFNIIKLLNYNSLKQFSKIKKKSVCGRIDYHKPGHKINNSLFYTWLRTSILIFKNKELKQILKFSTIDSNFYKKNKKFSKIEKKLNLSKNYKSFIDNWLSGKELDRRLPGKWSSNFFKKPNKFQILKKKISIINEHLLSQILRMEEFQIIDLYALKTLNFSKSEIEQHKKRLKFKKNLY